METCLEIAIPLAQATKNSLLRQNIAIEVRILESFLLEIYPDKYNQRDVQPIQTIKKQIDQSGNIGDITIALEKIENLEGGRLDENC